MFIARTFVTARYHVLLLFTTLVFAIQDTESGCWQVPAPLTIPIRNVTTGPGITRRSALALVGSPSQVLSLSINA